MISVWFTSQEGNQNDWSHPSHPRAQSPSRWCLSFTHILHHRPIKVCKRFAYNQSSGSLRRSLLWPDLYPSLSISAGFDEKIKGRRMISLALPLSPVVFEPGWICAQQIGSSTTNLPVKMLKMLCNTSVICFQLKVVLNHHSCLFLDAF